MSLSCPLSENVNVFVYKSQAVLLHYREGTSSVIRAKYMQVAFFP